MTTNTLRRASAIAAMVTVATSALASPVTYTFSTNGAPSGNTAIIALLGGTSQVSGQFQYDNAASYYGNSGAMGFGGNASVYVGNATTSPALSLIGGSVSGHSFSDVFGSVGVSNDTASTGDMISLLADPSVKAGVNTLPTDYPRQLVGFEVGDYRLANVRMFWATGVGGVGDFLTDTSLPAQLPAFQGRLALDFVSISDPNNLANSPYYSNSVFFDGLVATASAVPEEGSMPLMLMGLAGMLGLGLTGARRRAQ